MEWDGALHHRPPLRPEHRRRHVSPLGLAGHPRPPWRPSVNITFRLLYNDAIAMTGGQAATGRLGVVELTHWLATEGVKRVIVTTEDPGGAGRRERCRRSPPCATATTSPRPRRELAAVDGVTVLLHTDRCATEERRLRKRGKLPTPARGAWINERVCEGCGDCGRKSTCLSVIPVDTELGRKTRIHQSSCTQDMACLEGDCPSFVLVTPDRRTPGGGPCRRCRPTLAHGDPAPAFDAEPDGGHPHAGDRRHRRGHRLPGPADGRRRRRTLVGRTRPDRAGAEGRSGRLRRAHRADGPSRGAPAGGGR